MPINPKLKQFLIENEKKIKEGMEDGVDNWHNYTWIDFCLRELNDELFYSSYEQYLFDKIEKGKHENDIDKFAENTKLYFISYLFLECNKVLAWWPNLPSNYRLNPSYVLSALKYLEREKPNNPPSKILDQFYQKACDKWLTTTLAKVDILDRQLFYKNALQVYFDTMHVGIFGAREILEQTVKSQYESVLSQEGNFLHFTYDNVSCLYQSFLQFLSNQTTLKPFYQLCDQDIIFKVVSQIQLSDVLNEDILRINQPAIANIIYKKNNISNSWLCN